MDRVRSNEYPRWVGGLSPAGGLKKRMDDEWEQHSPKQFSFWDSLEKMEQSFKGE